MACVNDLHGVPRRQRGRDIRKSCKELLHNEAVSAFLNISHLNSFILSLSLRSYTSPQCIYLNFMSLRHVSRKCTGQDLPFALDKFDWILPMCAVSVLGQPDPSNLVVILASPLSRSEA